MPTTSDRRRQPRIDRAVPIEVRFGTELLVGASANVSADGVYFVAKGPVTVEVRVTEAGRTQVHRGRLVRLQSADAAGDDLGVAVRFEPAPAKKAAR